MKSAFKKRPQRGRGRPEHWYKDYPIAKDGKRQSPIDIVTKDVQKIEENTLTIEYPNGFDKLNIINTGHGWKVTLPSEIAKKTIITGGPLSDHYRLDQFHLHWGPNSKSGSEHTIDGKSYAAELHFVHWNYDKYSSVMDAIKGEKGLSVLGVFLEIDDNNNESSNTEIDKLVSVINSVKYKDQSSIIDEKIDIYDLLPKEKSYYTYEGSLTTPPLYESVIWIVFDKPIKLNSSQIDKFRTLYINTIEDNSIDDNIIENYRPVQPLNGRQIYYYN